MANRSDPLRRRPGGNRPRRVNRRAMTVGAAASLVLTVTPALVAPTPATASQSPLGLQRSQSTPTRQGAVAAFRVRLRAAVARRSFAMRKANADFRSTVGPHRAAMVRAQSVAGSRTDRREARVRFGQAVLPAKVALNAALEAARVEYIEAAEQARIDFLTVRGASGDTIAHARFRQAVNHATAEYQAAVVYARDSYRANSAVARTTTLLFAEEPHGRARSQRPAEAVRHAIHDVTAVFRSQLSSARHTYQSKLAVAKRSLNAAVA